MGLACGDIGVEACQEWILHARVFPPVAWPDKMLLDEHMSCVLTEYGDMMLWLSNVLICTFLYFVFTWAYCTQVANAYDFCLFLLVLCVNAQDVCFVFLYKC